MLLVILWMTISNVRAMDCNSPFCPPYLQQPKLTLEENLPRIFLGKLDGCTCRESPNDYTICYSEEKCGTIPRWLKVNTPIFVIKFTYIKEIKTEDFMDFRDLSKIIIEENNLLVNITPYAFYNLSNLIELSIIHNPKLKYLHPNAFIGLVNLRTLILVKNGFNSILHVTLALPSSVLPYLKTLNLSKNIFRNISSDDFYPMENSAIEELNLSLCSIENMSEVALLPLRNLKTLHLGNNRLNVHTITNLVNETINANIPLHTLALNSLGFRNEAPKNLMQLISHSNLTNINLMDNYFDIIDGRTFPYMRNLEKLDLSDNSVQSIETNAFLQMIKLKILLLNKNKLTFLPKELDFPSLERLEIEENMDFYYGVQFVLSEYQFLNFPKLEYLSFQYTRLLSLQNLTFLGSKNLKYLNLKNCSLIYIANNTFMPLASLKYLNLESNSLNTMWTLTSKYNLNGIFKGLNNLETLLLGKNNIQYVTFDGINPFVNLKSLHHLSLHKNQIQYLSPNDFKCLKNLKTLDVSKNSIISWNENVFFSKSLRFVSAHSNKISFVSSNMLDDFLNLTHLDLSSNRLTCNCWTLKDFSKYPSEKIKHFFKINKELHCVHFTNVSFEKFITNPDSYSKNCTFVKYPFLYILPLIFTFVIFLLLGLLMYIYRWHVRYWLFLSKLYLTRKGKKKTSTGCSNYDYDAFISYCNEDQNFVMGLVTMLENHEPFLRLCVYEREFKIGSIISESILEHIAKSRKTVLVVSNSYAKSYWCTWETHIAEHHRLFFDKSNNYGVDDSLVIIKLGEVNESHLTPNLRYLLKTRIYLQWDPEEDRQKVFWDKLRGCLSPPKIHDKQNILYCSHL